MEKIGNIEIQVIGKSGNDELKPDNFDIKYIANLLQDVESLLFPNAKKERPLITYDIENGSVKHIFKTTMQAVIGFSAVLSQVQEKNSIDFLELKTARAIENIQNISLQKNYVFKIKTSLKDNYELIITSKTHFFRTENIWIDAEFYFYGTLTNAGGKSKANIHLDTEEYGSLTINTDKDYLMEQKKNLLYKKFGIRAIGKQNIETGELDTKSLNLIELINYQPNFDSKYLNGLISNAKKNLQNINDPDSWLQDLRGGYES